MDVQQATTTVSGEIDNKPAQGMRAAPNISGEVRELKHENKELISEIRGLMEKTNTERELRDAENASVKQSAKQAEECRKKVEEQKKKVEQLEKELGPVKKQLSSLAAIQKEISQLEYQLHLQGASPREERRISKRINELNAQAKQLAAAAPKAKQLEVERNTLRELNKNLSAAVKSLREHVEKSEEHHGKMLELTKQVHELEAKLSTSLTDLEQKREQLSKLKPKKEPYKKKQHKPLPATRGISAAEVKKKAEEILAKFKAGESITAEEMQVLSFANVEF